MLFTVGIPVYNKKKYLRKCLESVERQTYRDYEILLVDDCSTDGSREALEELSETFKKYRLIKNSNNQGLSNNRNIILHNAKGEYVVFLDPDDTIEPNLLASIAEVIKDDVDMIRYQINVIGDKTGKDPERFNFYENCGRKMSGEEALEYFTQTADKRYALACSFCIRREFFLENELSFPINTRIYEDLATIPIALSKANGVVIIECKGYNYMKNPDSLTMSLDSAGSETEKRERVLKDQMAFLNAIQRVLGEIAKSTISDRVKDMCMYDFFGRIENHNRSLQERLLQSKSPKTLEEGEMSEYGGK